MVQCQPMRKLSFMYVLSKGDDCFISEYVPSIVLEVVYTISVIRIIQHNFVVHQCEKKKTQNPRQSLLRYFLKAD